MDFWDQVPPWAYWNNQINRSINAETAACPKRQAAFCFIENGSAFTIRQKALRAEYDWCTAMSYAQRSVGRAHERKEIANEKIFTRS